VHESPSVVGICGNPAPGSKTLALTIEVVESVVGLFPGAPSQVIDLSTHAERVLAWGDQDVEASRDLVRAADLVVVATPVYKGSYTGLLKAFLDGFDLGELTGVLAVPLTIAASPAHSLAGPSHLEPVLRELGCSVPGGTLHVPDRSAADPAVRGPIIGSWVERHRALLATAGRVVAR
jgi:FMN reductase